jgi:hypothetical protein
LLLLLLQGAGADDHVGLHMMPFDYNRCKRYSIRALTEQDLPG